MAEKLVKDSQGLAKDLVNDCISRQAAIDAVFDRMNVEKYGRNAKPEEIQWALEKLPSAQPEQQWIPCSERLPKTNQIVLLSTNSNNVYVGYRNKPELLWQVEEDGGKQWVYDPESYDVDIDVLPKTEDIDFYCEGVNDGGFLSITSANYNDRFEGVTAWMSLPEPYREVE